ncbi:unnamed protein product [Closterium sp. Naga37s-1]|nr:unnamed protein product [Closterium sp. Naga37s-1]
MADKGNGLGNNDAFDYGNGSGAAGLATVRSGYPEGTGGAEEKGRAGGGTGGVAGGGDTKGAEEKEEEESGDEYVDDGEGDWTAQPGMRVQQTKGGEEEMVEMLEDTATDAEMKELAQNSGHAGAAQGGAQNREQSGTSRAPASVLPLPLASANAPAADVARRKDSTGAGQRKDEQTTGQVPKQQIAQHGGPVVPQGGYIDVRKRQAAGRTGEGGQLTESQKRADSQQSPSKVPRGDGEGDVASGRKEGKPEAGKAGGGVGGNNDGGGDYPDGGDVGNDKGSDGSDTTGADSGTTGADEVISLGGDVEGGDGDERDYGTDAETMSQASTAGTGMDVGNGNGQGYDSDSVFAAANDGGLDVGMMFLSSNSMVGKPVVGAGAGGRAKKPPGGGTGKTGYEGERKAANHRTRTKPRFKAVDCQYREKGAFSKLHRCAVGYAGHAGVTGKPRLAGVTVVNSGGPMNLTMLLGADDGDMNDANMRVTVYRNWFDQSGQRQPKARWGQIHVANNLYTNWTYYCIGFMFFAKDNRDKVKKESPTASFGEIGKLLGQRWGSLESSEKAVYLKMAEEDKSRYVEETKALKRES